MNFKTLLEKLKTYPLAIISFLLVIIFLGLNFSRSGITDELSVEEGDLTSKLRAIEENVKNAEGLNGHLEALETLVSEINERLFDRDERAVNINFFYDLENQYDVTFDSINQRAAPDALYEPKGARELKRHSTIVFNLNLSGSFKDVIRFIHGLHQVEPLLRVADFRVSDAAEVESPEDVNATLRIVVLSERGNS